MTTHGGDGTMSPRVLIIDDEEMVRDTLVAMLETAGYEVIAAANGEEGIRLHRQAPADIVITDIVMPDKEGIETIMELRSVDRGVKIIAMSGSGGETYLSSARKLGADRALAKPFDIEKLLETIRELTAEG